MAWNGDKNFWRRPVKVQVQNVLKYVTFYRKRCLFQSVWHQSSGTFCTWTLTSKRFEKYFFSYRTNPYYFHFQKRKNANLTQISGSQIVYSNIFPFLFTLTLIHCHQQWQFSFLLVQPYQGFQIFVHHQDIEMKHFQK